MYRLTPRMLQRLNRDLGKYHELFDGGRCAGWELEELIVAAIQSDTRAQHQVRWREAGHDDLADIAVRTNGETHPLQVKSGKISAKRPALSGHRLGRFAGDFGAITRYLNANSANLFTVPYHQTNDQRGRKHIYRVCYVDVQRLTGLKAGGWAAKGKQFVQTNGAGVGFSLRPSLSWQIGWAVPVDLIEQTDAFVIG